MSLWKEFREFISKGNVLGLAIAVTMGVAFGAVVGSFTNDILMQLIAALGAKPDFSALSFTLNKSEIRYGSFLTAVVSFLVISFALFAVVKVWNLINRPAPRKEEVPKETELDLLREIRDELRRQPQRA